jgi:glyoxylase-like metal-dependent hydrolase (beta-lactamase superfamily II)
MISSKHEYEAIILTRRNQSMPNPPKFEKISEHIRIMHAEHATDRPILAAIAGERRTLLMDAGNSPAHAALFREELQRQGVRLPDLMVLTHWHWDHSFGMSAWNIPAAAHEGTAKALHRLSQVSQWSDEAMEELIQEGCASDSTVRNIQKEYGVDRASIQIVLPELRFTDRITIDLGGVTCVLEHVGGDHSSDSCFLYIEEDRVLFTGDALGPSVYGGPRKYTASSFLGLINWINRSGAQIIVESHGSPMTREIFEKDVEPWVLLARLTEQFGGDKVRILEELTKVLHPAPVPNDLLMAADWFMEGLKDNTA